MQATLKLGTYEERERVARRKMAIAQMRKDSQDRVKRLLERQGHVTFDLGVYLSRDKNLDAAPVLRSW